MSMPIFRNEASKSSPTSFVVEVATKAADADADATGGGESPNLADRKKQRQQAKKQKQQSQSQSQSQSGPTTTAGDGQNPLPAVVVSGDHSEDAVVVVLPQEQATTTPAKAPSGGARPPSGPEAHPSAGAAIRPRFRRPASREFLLALAAGALALGASAALGFVLGVVHVTEPLFRVFPLEKPKQRSMAVPQRGQKRVLKATIKGIKLSQKGTTLTIAGSEG